MDLGKIQTELYQARYLAPQDFLDEAGKMEHITVGIWIGQAWEEIGTTAS
jgi:hypothetical protein